MDSSDINSDNVKASKESNVTNNSDHLPNGLSNGLNSKSDSHHKHKHKSKDKDKEKHGEKHKHKDKERDRDKHSHSSSKDKSKEGGEHRKEKDERKDKEHRSKDKDHHSRDKDKELSKSKATSEKDKESKDKSKEYRDKHKDHKSSSKDKEHKSSSNSKHSENDKRSSSHKNSEKSRSSSKHTSSKDGKSHNNIADKDKHHTDKYKHSKHSSSDKTSSSKHSSSEKQSRDTDKNSSIKEDFLKKDKEYEVSVTGESCEYPQDNSFDQSNQSTAIVRDKSNTHMIGQVNKANSIIKEEYKSDDDTCNEVSFNKKSIKDECDEEKGFEVDEITNEAGDSNIDSEEEEKDIKIKTEIKQEEEELSEDDIPLSQRFATFYKSKRKISHCGDASDDDIPMSVKLAKLKKEKKADNNPSKRKSIYTDDENESDYEKPKKKAKLTKPKIEVKSTAQTPTKKKKVKEEEEQEVWKWWEEEKKEDGVKWNFLEHKGPMFAPAYEPLPPNIKLTYDGKEIKLSQDAEEIATFYARMIEHEYTTKEAFNKNFFKDWRKYMTTKEKELITDLKKCDFRKMHAYFIQKSEERKAMSKEEKKKLKEANEEIVKVYGFCFVDGHKEKIGNFKIEPPGLFRGRGEHPKMGMLKKRVVPEDVIINCSKDAKVPDPPKGHKWKEVRHDNTVTWLASWVENVQGQVKYVMLNPSSKLKGEKDWQKYETARKLAKCVEKIRNEYREDWKSKEMRIRQRAVALYFIDKLALRAGNEKDEDQADTVGCCSLRVEHIQLFEEKDGKNYVVVFDFLGKDSIRYYNEVPVEKRVFKNLQLFMDRKQGGDDLFDRLNTAVLNKHLNELMEGLTAKVFRTFNASFTLQNQLDELTDSDASVPEKILQYNRANRAVAILCNHQRSIPKSHEKSMGNLKQKIDTKKEQIEIANRQYKDAKREAKDGSTHSKMVLDKKKKALERLKEQLMKLEVQETDKEENKTIALGTSKLNYLDPRISVAWCKKHGVPIEKIYNKTQRMKFRWAIDMAGPEYVF